MQSLKVSETLCKICQEVLDNDIDLQRHMKTKHSEQWNCDKCDFQASTREILMKHCKSSGHNPSKLRLGQTGVLECYTCRNEFRSFNDLMNHRKE